MLVACPACGRKVSRQAPACPFCRSRTPPIKGVVAPAAGAGPLKPGHSLGSSLHILKVLGEGGFGLVYLARSPTQGFCAVKTLRDALLHDNRVLDLFQKEARIWIELNRHPFLVRAHYVDEINGRLYLVMEFIPPNDHGLNDLEGYLRREPPDLSRALWWAIEFCHGMEYAYSKGVRCHRDVKPSNILIGSDGRVRVTDFGISGVIVAKSEASSAGTSPLGEEVEMTQAGAVFGTPTHMSPEQFTDAASCDARSDVYSFGVVLFQMVSAGRLPFFPSGASTWEAFARLHRETPVPRLDSRLFPIIARSMEKDPARRYRSFPELRSDLEALLREKTGETVSVPAPKHLEAADWNNKGLSFASLDQPDDAIACYDHALATDPDLAPVLNNKGNALRTIGRLPESIACFDRALSLDPKYAVAYLNKAISLTKLGRHQDALSCLEKALALDGRLSDAWVTKGVLLSRLGQRDKSLECYERALAIAPRDPIAWFNKGIKLYERQKREDALSCMEKALAEDPRHVDAWMTKGILLGELGRSQEALQAFDRALALRPDDSKCWYNKGNVYTAIEKFDEAQRCFQRTTELEPSFPVGWYNRALAELKLERYPDAQASLRQFLSRAHAEDPFRSQAEGLLAELEKGQKVKIGSLSKGDTILSDRDTGAKVSVPVQEAHAAGDRDARMTELERLSAALDSDQLSWDEKLKVIERIEELTPAFDAVMKLAFGIETKGSPEAADAEPPGGELRGLLEKGTALLKDNRAAEAVSVFERALMLDPGSADAWTGKGESLNRLARHQEGLPCLNRALAIAPDHAHAWYQTGNSLGALGRRSEAVSAYDRAVALAPGNHRAWHNRAVSLYELGRYEEAIDSSRHAVEIWPQFAWAWNCQGRALHGLRRFDEAIAAFDKALESNPKDIDVWNNKGLSLKALGRLVEALDCFQKVLAGAPRDTDGIYNRASTLDEMGRKDEALQGYRQFALLATGRQGTILQKARDRIQALSGAQPAGGGPSGAGPAEYLKRAAITHNQGQFQKAVAWFDQALALDPKSSAALVGKGESLRCLSRHAEALAAFDGALEVNPEDAASWIKKAGALESLGRPEEALASYAKAMELEPENLAISVGQGACLLALGRADEALASFDRALSKDPRFALARFHKATAEERLGRQADAARSFQQFLSTAPPTLGPLIQKARARLMELKSR